LAGRVLLKIVYLLVRRVLGLFVLVFREDLAKDAELLVLRHENAVLRRHAGRIRYEPADRVWFAALARLIPRGCRAEVFPVTRRHCCPGTASWPPGSTTRATGASQDGRLQSAASPAWPSARRRRTRCRDTGGSTAS
jgi:hypothetical protein